MTPDKKNYIYDYGRFGSMAFSSDITGTALIKTISPFVEDAGLNIEGMIGGWLAKDTLLVYDFRSDLEQPTDTLPIKTEYINLDNLVLKKVYYKSNSGGRAIHTFDSLKIEDKRLKVFGIDSKSGSENLTFLLGPITAHVAADSISYLEIEVITKSMHFVRIDKTGRTLTGQPEVGTLNYELTPKRKIRLKEIGKVGIFWAVIKKEVIH